VGKLNTFRVASRARCVTKDREVVLLAFSEWGFITFSLRYDVFVFNKVDKNFAAGLNISGGDGVVRYEIYNCFAQLFFFHGYDF